LFLIITLAISPSIYAKEPIVIHCTPYGHVTLSPKNDAGNRLQLSETPGRMGDKKLTITIKFKEGVVINKLDNEVARETIHNVSPGVYFIKSADPAYGEYYGAYTFSKDYKAAIYSADGAFSTYLKCEER